MPDNTKISNLGVCLATNKTWQQREKEKVKTHIGSQDWQHFSTSSFSSSLSCSSRRSSTSSSVSWQQSPHYLRTSSSSSWQQNSSTPVCHWPSYGNSSSSPLPHKFSGMGMRDVLNVTLAQEMSSLGMGRYSPVDMTMKELNLTKHKK
jgi:hypothetical protein